MTVSMRCRGSLEVNDVFSDISASPLEMRFLGTTGSVHEGDTGDVCGEAERLCLALT